jgi:hypothetical protein
MSSPLFSPVRPPICTFWHHSRIIDITREHIDHPYRWGIRLHDTQLMQGPHALHEQYHTNHVTVKAFAWFTNEICRFQLDSAITVWQCFRQWKRNVAQTPPKGVLLYPITIRLGLVRSVPRGILTRKSQLSRIRLCTLSAAILLETRCSQSSSTPVFFNGLFTEGIQIKFNIQSLIKSRRL